MDFTDSVVQHIDLDDTTQITNGNGQESYNDMFTDNSFKARFNQEASQVADNHVAFEGLKFGTDGVDTSTVDDVHNTGLNHFTHSNEVRSELNEGDHAGTYQDGDKFAMRHTHFEFQYLVSRDGSNDV